VADFSGMGRKRGKYRIVEIGSRIGQKAVRSNAGIFFRNAVLVDVVCDKII